jgi:hypothetical protein
MTGMREIPEQISHPKRLMNSDAIVRRVSVGLDTLSPRQETIMNKTFIFVAATVGIIGMSGLANASDGNRSGDDYGTVINVDRAGQTITLASGSTYTDPFAGDLNGIRVGEKVRITYDDGEVVSITR